MDRYPPPLCVAVALAVVVRQPFFGLQVRPRNDGIGAPRVGFHFAFCIERKMPRAFFMLIGRASMSLVDDKAWAWEKGGAQERLGSGGGNYP